MPSYKAPLDDMRFILNEVLGIARLSKLEAFKDLDQDTINGFLTAGAQISEELLQPLNATGDHEGCVYDKDAKTVKTPTGFKEAYEQFCQSGFPALACDPAYGGLGMPIVLNTAIGEMFCSANMAFGMYPGLSHGAYNALHEFGSDDMKNKYLAKLVSGEWTGTMCLTEPQAGTDLGLIKTKAVKQADGTYKITGTKIFISAGEHDLAENICHLVLAKIEDPSTPEGVKGISLFIVPKINADGSRNPAFCGRIEEKMGIHGNATCEMQFEAAAGELVGEPNKGMKGMFVMMNEARLGVGLQGLGLSEVAYQNALAYALDRVQGQKIDAKGAKDQAPKSVKIIDHADVRRELLTIKSAVEGERMMACWVSLQLDISKSHPDENERKKAKKIVDFLTPIIKAHFTDNAELNTSSAVQVFGGHGYITEHGMEQFYRDARITKLYEGTNGIQALDLIGRKVMTSKEGLLESYLEAVKADIKAAKKSGVDAEMISGLEDAVGKLKSATRRLKFAAGKQLLKKKVGLNGDMGPVMQEVAASATDYLKLASIVSMAHMWVKMADTAQQRLAQNPEGRDFYETKIKTARFYFDKVVPQVYALEKTIKTGSRSLVDIAADKFAHTQTSIAEKAPEPGSKPGNFFGL